MTGPYPLIVAELLPGRENDPVQLRLPDGRVLDMGGAPIGTAFEIPQDSPQLQYWYRLRSAEYDRDHAASRGMYLIKVPCGLWFSPDKHVTPVTGVPADRHGWTVTGTLEDLTVSPSVAMNAGHEFGWHGWIGVNGTPPGRLSRDLDGRPF
ncbi:hypothetical protein IHN32_00310 [Deinococcus sp. 14RED07]|uniref:DUF6527 family protein n=1 Tax=unclassified Deinococcus TaxID=2623546 RepID=UPI001E4F2C0E|nr:hypothetical protein [Deinococcus sp. 12RED42]MCD0174399.1 hypothetical protein [Deinococcus sp. 14RED07]